MIQPRYSLKRKESLYIYKALHLTTQTVAQPYTGILFSRKNATAWLNIKVNVLSEISQRTNSPWQMIPCIWNCIKCKLIHSDRKWISVCLGPSVGWEAGATQGQDKAFSADGDVHSLDWADGCTRLYTYVFLNVYLVVVRMLNMISTLLTDFLSV